LVFEYEVQGVKRGQKVEAVAPSIPGKVFLGKISSISPILNAPTRTVRVRAEVPDPEGLLRPETFLNVKIKIERGEKLAIPEDSVLHSGDRSFVFVVKEKGRFEPRPVSLGQKTGDFFEVIDGLKEGEEVVTAANFLIDSESRLRAVLQQMSPTNPPAEKHHDRKNH
jgi:Cu(I)/Ag(I) efflux system membrane fusion protein